MNARKDDLDDVLKLVSFFKDMKAINDEFSMIYKQTTTKQLKTFSGPMQAVEEHIKTSAIASHTTQLTRPTYFICLWECLLEQTITCSQRYLLLP